VLDLPRDHIEKKYDRLQSLLVEQAPEIVEFSEREHTVVVIPSLSLDTEQLAKVKGISFYEERMLYLLLLLRQPKAKVVLVTSQQVDFHSIEYVLRLLPIKEMRSARERLFLYWANDYSPKPLAAKVLERPWLLHRIRAHIEQAPRAHMATFNVTETEMDLAVALGVPIVGLDPRLGYWGTKSGNRRAFAEAEVRTPEGFGDLHQVEEVVESLESLWRRTPGLRRAVVKLNEGFSGEGNAILEFKHLAAYAPGRSERSRRLEAIEKSLEDLVFQSPRETWEKFSRSFQAMGGVVEVFIEGERKLSPSVQLRVDVLGHLAEHSTHDQVLGGAMNQVFLGCRFPADARYRKLIQVEARRVGEVLRDKGIQGRLGVDFLVTEKANGSLDCFAIEVNIRRGGTTHPFAAMHFLIQGEYEQATGIYRTPEGEERCYFASDNVEECFLKGLLPEDLRSIVEQRHLGFDHFRRLGNVFHMLGAASQFHKIGFTAIAGTGEAAQEGFDRTKREIEAAVRDDPVGGDLEAPHQASRLHQ
jgi:hypothetical protein